MKTVLERRPATDRRHGRWPALLLAGLLAACSTTGGTRPADKPADPVAATAADATQAVAAPLNDLNLVRAEIPPVLHAALQAPYALPAQPGCAGLKAEVEALDAVLGPDLDTPATAANPGLVERGTGALGNAATGALRGAAEGVIPFRGWVRKLTGAERYAREVAAAIAAGTVRRSFLKGLGQALVCPAPASPRR